MPAGFFLYVKFSKFIVARTNMKKILLPCLLLVSLFTAGLTQAQMPGDSLYANTRDSIGAYKDVEVYASYPGGEKVWQQFLMKNLDLSVIEKDVPSSLNIKKTFMLQFIVCTDGTICNIEAINDDGSLPSCRKEAVRIISKSGKWVPAMKNGKPIKSFKIQPITFIQESE